MNINMFRTKFLEDAARRYGERFDPWDLERLHELEELFHQHKLKQDEVFELVKLREVIGLARWAEAEYQRAYYSMPRFLRRAYKKRYACAENTV